MANSTLHPPANLATRLLGLNSSIFSLTACLGQSVVQKYASYVPRLIARLHRPRQGNFLLSTYGVWLTSEASDRTYKMCVDGSYGPFYQNYVSRLPRCHFMDIGSNIGLYSLVAGQNRNISRIFSFEPNPQTYGYLVENLRFNHVTNATPVAKAISGAMGHFVLKTYSGHLGKASMRPDTEQDPPDGEITIETVDQDFMNSLMPDDKVPVAIKIDVEGHEIVVIETLRKARLWKNVFSIYFEVDERYIDVRKVVSMLEGDGFRLKSKNGERVHYDLLYERALQA